MSDRDDKIAARMLECPDFCDFPTAWAIQEHADLTHHPRCSSLPGWHPLSGSGLLCDCGAVVKEWERRAALAAMEAGDAAGGSNG